MAASISGARFVRCPNCRHVLLESPNIAVYQCGGCGTILRSKNYSVSKRNDIGESLDINSQDAPSSFSNNESAKETTAHMTEVDKTTQKAATDKQNSSSTHYTEKLATSEHGEHINEDHSSDIHTSNPSKQSSSILNDKHATIQDSVARKLEGDCATLDVEEEKFSRLPDAGYESFKLNERAMDNAESTMSNGTSEEDADARRDRQVDSFDSATSKPHIYGHHVSTFDVGHNTHSSDDIILFKTLHIGSEEIQEMIEGKLKQGGEGRFFVDKLTAEAEKELPADNLRANPLNQVYTSDIVDKFQDNVADKSARRKKNVQKDTSLDSADFHSVQNWFNSENNASSGHLSIDSVFDEYSLEHQHESTSAKLRNLENVQLQILKKVDDLRDEISGLFHIPVKVKGRSLLRDADKQRFCSHFRSKLVRQYSKGNEPSLVPSSPYENLKDGYEKENAEIKEKRKPIKHHCRPLLGGAPFVFCCNCLNLLQLPLDFVVKRKRFYSLQCGNCSKVLMFSFRSQKHNISLTPNSDTPTDVQHPPSEVSTSQLSDARKSDPALHATDYELSFGIRYPVNVEQLLHDPGTSSDPLAEKNTEFRKKSKLHWLMGYGSASELLFQQSKADGGSENETNYTAFH